MLLHIHVKWLNVWATLQPRKQASEQNYNNQNYSLYSEKYIGCDFGTVKEVYWPGLYYDISPKSKISIKKKDHALKHH